MTYVKNINQRINWHLSHFLTSSDHAIWSFFVTQPYPLLNLWKNSKLIFFQFISNLKINMIFETFKKKKCKFMCLTWSQDKVDDAIDNIIALNDDDDKCLLVSFCQCSSLFCFWAVKTERYESTHAQQNLVFVYLKVLIM